MGVRWVQRVALILVVVGLLVGPAFVLAENGARQDGDTGTLEPLAGIVQRRPVEAPPDDWETISAPVLVAKDDIIRTNEAGHAVVTFFSGVQADIWPNSLVSIDLLAVGGEDERSHVTLGVPVGDVLHRINGLMATDSIYEVHTPGAVITVRGTEFWTQVDENERTRVSAMAGEVTVTGVDPAGAMTTEVVLGPGEAVTIPPEGVLGDIEPVSDLPGELSARVPVAHPGCGDGACSPAEAEEGICPVDCEEFPGCGDGECDRRAGEDVVTCEADCVPRDDPNGEEEPDVVFLHFYWGGMRCDFWPPEGPYDKPVLMHWGVGCFDSGAHASAHPHPADYQLTVDGQPWDMSSMRQSGPHVHMPDCPWGWSFAMAPQELPPGTHRLVLEQTLTDTWTTLDGVASQAGSRATLGCVIEIADHAPGEGD